MKHQAQAVLNDLVIGNYEDEIRIGDEDQARFAADLWNDPGVDLIVTKFDTLAEPVFDIALSRGDEYLTIAQGCTAVEANQIEAYRAD